MSCAFRSLIRFLLLLSVFIASSSFQPLFGQEGEIEKLEEEIKEEKGSPYVVKAVRLGELYLQKGEYEEGISWLKKATRETRRQRISAMIAQVNKTVAETIIANAPPKAGEQSKYPCHPQKQL